METKQTKAEYMTNGMGHNQKATSKPREVIIKRVLKYLGLMTEAVDYMDKQVSIEFKPHGIIEGRGQLCYVTRDSI